MPYLTAEDRAMAPQIWMKTWVHVFGSMGIARKTWRLPRRHCENPFPASRSARACIVDWNTWTAPSRLMARLDHTVQGEAGPGHSLWLGGANRYMCSTLQPGAQLKRAFAACACAFLALRPAKLRKEGSTLLAQNTAFACQALRKIRLSLNGCAP